MLDVCVVIVVFMAVVNTFSVPFMRTGRVIVVVATAASVCVYTDSTVS